MSSNKPTTTAKKEEPNQLIAQVEATASPEPQLEEGTPEPEQVEVQPEETKVEKLEPPKSLNMAYLYSELQAVKQVVQEHSQQIAELQEALARKRKAVPNGKVQILDKKTGQVFPSKNNAYQTLLKAGEIKSLVDAGVFGADPVKNTFGWYALVRALPDRFEEIKAEEKIIDGK